MVVFKIGNLVQIQRFQCEDCVDVDGVSCSGFVEIQPEAERSKFEVFRLEVNTTLNKNALQ